MSDCHMPHPSQSDQFLQQLFARCQSRLIAFLSSKMGNAAISGLSPEDVAHDVVLKAHNKRHTYKEEASRDVCCWLYMIAQRELADRYRRCNRETNLSDDHVLASSGEEDAIDQVRAKYKKLVFEASIAKLSEKHPVILRYIVGDLSSAEAAQILGTTVNNIHVSAHRRRRELLRESLTQSQSLRARCEEDNVNNAAALAVLDRLIQGITTQLQKLR